MWVCLVVKCRLKVVNFVEYLVRYVVDVGFVCCVCW